MSSDPAIRVSSLGKCYHLYERPSDRLRQFLWRGRRTFHREFWALQELSLTVEPGETLGVIGRNGSGKSTLLQILCGTLAPTVGAIEITGRVSALLELGAGFNPEFTGSENIAVAGAVLGLERRELEARRDFIVSFADIGEFIDQPLKTYSTGMQVRLGFAVAISIDPEVLLVDEALAVGDIFFQQKCIQHMREELGDRTKVLVSHDLHAICNLTDRVLVLDEGRLAFLGPPLEAVEHYTRLVHTATYAPDTPPPEPQDPQTSTGVANLPWTEVAAESRGGAGDVNILRVALTGAGGEPAALAQEGDALALHMLVDVPSPGWDLIFGYIVNDRVGNGIFGENTVRTQGGPVRVDAPGHHHVTLRIRWPEVKPGEYTVTLGVGDGRDAAGHRIQCWAHNLIAVEAISPGRIVHCLFNNDIDAVEVERVD